MPSSIQVAKVPTKRTTFGTGPRDWSTIPKNMPAPNAYSPSKFTEASHMYSFPKSMKSEEAKLYKASFAPGPGAYEVRRDDKQEGPAKSFLGGPLDHKVNLDNGVPGPGNYNPKDLDHVSGFRIVPQSKRDGEGDQGKDDETEKVEPVGP